MSGEPSLKTRRAPTAILRPIDLGHRVRAHDAGDGIAVGDADADETQLLGAQHQFFGIRGAAQETRNSS